MSCSNCKCENELSEMTAVNIDFKLNYSDARLPKQAHYGDAGMDLYAYEEGVVLPGEVKVIDCGFSMAMPVGWEAQVRPRSGLAAKNMITVINTPGTIDCAYRGPVKVPLLNLGSKPFLVEKDMRIAQMVIAKVPQVFVNVVSELPESKRGTGGFGSTGK